MNKIDKFYQVKDLLQCPVCGKKIRFHAGGLVCKREHRFDISAKGYVNMLQETRAMKGYDRDFFASRRRIFERGYYDHIVQGVVDCLVACNPAVIADAGCGEGFYALAARRCAQLAESRILAFDLSADAIKRAAKSDLDVEWMVADLTNIPMKDGSCSAVLDIFTPANYGEFSRILAEDGVLIKVVPGANHMGQLRRAAAPLLRNQTYSNEDVLDGFRSHYRLIEQKHLSATLPVDEEALEDLTAMTPLLFDVDPAALDLSALREITVEGELLAGKIQSAG